MKRVLIAIKGLGPGGAEQLLVEAAPYLDRSKFDYQVAYLLPNASALVAPLSEAGLRVTCLGGAGPAWVPRFRSLVKSERIDLIHVHSPYVAVGVRAVIDRASGPSIVYSEHCPWAAYRRLTYWGNILTFPRNDYVIAVSDHVRESLRYPGPFRSLPMPPVETLYHGIDPLRTNDLHGNGEVRRELGIGEEVPVVGMVANFTLRKGHRFLLRALREVRPHFPDVCLVLVGDGPILDDVRRDAAHLGLSQNIIFTGGRPDAARIASSFDIFVLSSLREGLSIALIEAMARGKPSVVTRIGGLSEVLEHGKQGLMVQPSDHRSLAAALLTLLRKPDMRKRFGDAARERAAVFDIRNAVGRTEEIYQEVLP